jgi:hypothetical protein
MADTNDLGQTDAWKFAQALLATCPEQFRGEPRPIQFGIKLSMRRGGYLVVWFRLGGFVSRLSSESAAPPKEVLDALEAQVRGKLVGFNMRPALLRTIEAWRQPFAEVAPTSVASTVGRDPAAAEVVGGPQGHASAEVDPIAAVVPFGTIGVRKGSPSAGARIASGTSGPSGWSQAIGRACEQIAFQAICELCGDRCVPIDGDDARVRLRFESGERILEWINASGERGNSWDIEERDAATGAVIRMHEVKAPTAQLTVLEHALALRFGSNYLVWRVNPDTGACTQLSVRELAAGAQRFLHGASADVRTTSQPKPPQRAVAEDAGPTMVVLGSSTREFCRKLRRQHQGFVGRFRGNLVVAFKVTPELEAQLPPSASKVWIANRSRAGCERLLNAIRLVEAATFAAPRVGLLLVGLRVRSPHGNARALTGAVSAAGWVRASPDSSQLEWRRDRVKTTSTIRQGAVDTGECPLELLNTTSKGECRTATPITSLSRSSHTTLSKSMKLRLM